MNATVGQFGIKLIDLIDLIAERTERGTHQLEGLGGVKVIHLYCFVYMYYPECNDRMTYAVDDASE